jgi:hypothetical protein
VTQTPCNPSPTVVAAVSAASHHQVTAAQVCSQLQSSFSHVSFQGPSASSSSSIPALGAFAKSYADKVSSTAFDRVFAFTVILTIIGMIPAFFLRKPEKRPEQATTAIAA